MNWRFDVAQARMDDIAFDRWCEKLERLFPVCTEGEDAPSHCGSRIADPDLTTTIRP